MKKVFLSFEDFQTLQVWLIIIFMAWLIVIIQKIKDKDKNENEKVKNFRFQLIKLKLIIKV